MVTAITDIWSGLSTWITSSLSQVQVVFWAEGQLTFLGQLAFIGLGIGIFFLIMGVIQNFLHLRG